MPDMSFLNDNILRVRWRLNNSCLYECPYCGLPRVDDNCVILRERLLRMAWNILSIPASSYDITITGGEPALHVYLPDLLNYFLAAPRNARVTLETPAALNCDYYLRAAASLSREIIGRLRFIIAIHPRFSEPAQIITLIAGLADAGIACEAIVFDDGASQDHATFISDVIEKIKDKFGFAVSRKYVGMASRLPIEKTQLPPQDENPQILELLPQLNDDIVWQPGFLGGIFIEPDGKFRLCAGNTALSEMPLWQYDGFSDWIWRRPFQGQTVLSSHIDEFASLADTALENLRRSFQSKLAQMAYMPDPAFPSAPPAKLAYNRLKRAASPMSDVWNDPLLQDQISRIFAATHPGKSRNVFLAGVKAALEGDPSGIPFYDVGEDGAASFQDNAGFSLLQSENFWDYRRDVAEFAVINLAGSEKFLRYYKPTLKLPLSSGGKNIIDVPLALLEAVPDYELRFGADEAGEITIYAEQREFSVPALKEKWEDKGDNPIFSVVILASGASDALERSMDSALAQGLDRVELIVAAQAADDCAKAIQYIARFPKIVRLATVYASTGAAANAALAMTAGKYVTFLVAGEILASGILTKCMPLLELADIAVATAAIREAGGGGEQICKYPATPGIRSGIAALTAYLTEAGGPLSRLGGIFYRVDYLHSINARFLDSDYFYQIAFNALAHLKASKVFIAGLIGCYINDPPTRLDIAAAISSTRAMADFVASWELGDEFHGYRHCIEHIYRTIRASLPGRIDQALKSGEPVEELLEEMADGVRKCRPFMECLLMDYSELRCASQNITPIMDPTDADWRAAAARPKPTKTFIAYAGQPPNEIEPVLSIIIPNYNKAEYIQPCLDSVLAQNRINYEIIVIDDRSTDGSWETLQDYADIHQNVRLFRAGENCRQGSCRNLGIREARGKYIIFVDSDDIVEPGFFEHAIKCISASAADMVFFSLRIIRDGKTLISKIMNSKEFGPGECLKLFISGKLPPEPYAKIFSRDFLLRENIYFEDHIYHQDQYFIIRAVKAVKRASSDPFLAYSMIQTKGSTIRPRKRKYLHIHSACMLYSKLAELAAPEENSALRRHIIWNLENVLLYSLKAFKDGTGEFAIADADFRRLASNRLFSASLLEGLAKLAGTHRAIWKNLPGHTPAATKTIIPKKFRHPLVSIIVPVYNQRPLLERCLKSILEQSLDSIEVIVIDDASRDRSGALAKSLAQADNRLIILSNQVNHGQGWSRSRALRIARGKYITFVDSDDYVYDFLLHGVAWLEQRKDCEFAQFGLREMEGDKTTERVDYGRAIVLEDREYFLKWLGGKSSWWNAVAKLYRRDFLAENQIFIPDHLYEDNVFIIQAYSKCHNVIVDPMIAYAQIRTPHPASAMRPLQYTPRHLNGYLACAAWVSAYIRDNADLEKLGKKDKLVSRIEQRHALPGILEYIASFKKNDASPFTKSDIANLNASPELCRMILTNFAKLWAQKTDAKGHVSALDAGMREPASTLVPLRTPESPQALISVIIPAYNVRSFLEQCVDSAAAAPPRIEIILVEDSSNDGTLELCKQLAKKYPHLKLYKTPWNSGLGAARNLGMTVASGKYVTFLDSDDWLDSSFLPAALRLVETEDFDLASFNICSHWGDYLELYAKPRHSPGNFEACADHMTGRYKHYSAWGRLFNRQFLLANNIRFSPYIYEDVPFMLKVYTSAKKQLYVDQLSLHSRRDNTASLMNTREISKFRFMSQMHNLKEAFAIFSEYPEDEAAALKKLYLAWQMEPMQIFWNDVLGYIHFTTASELPSPLTDALLHELAGLWEFMPAILQKYAELYAGKGKANV